VAQVRPNELLIANLTGEALQPPPHLPVDIFPRHVLFAEELDESVHIPVAICNVLSNHSPMEVNEDLRIRAHHPVSLI